MSHIPPHSPSPTRPFGNIHKNRSVSGGVLFAAALLAAASLQMAVTPIVFADDDDTNTSQEGAYALGTPLSAAARVAASVQSFYDRTDSMTTRFSQSYYHALYRRTERAQGTLSLDKPGRMRFDYADGKVLVSDRGSMTIYEPGDEGEPGQYVKMRTNEDSLHRGFGFIMGTTRIDEDYAYRLLDGSRYGWRGSLLELRPRVSDPQIRRVLLYVDARPGRQGVVHRIRIDDHDGNRNTLTFRRMRFNVDFASEAFRFTAPTGSIRMSRPTR